MANPPINNRFARLLNCLKKLVMAKKTLEKYTDASPVIRAKMM